jgi:hypothetical protein
MKLRKLMQVVLIGGVCQLVASAQDFRGTPIVVAAVAPVYPAIAVATNTTGEIVIEVDVNRAGKVRKAKIVEGHSLLRKATFLENTAKKWVFNSDNRVASRKTRITFGFRIMPVDSTDEDLLSVFYPPNRVEVRSRGQQPVTDRNVRDGRRPSSSTGRVGKITGQHSLRPPGN